MIETDPELEKMAPPAVAAVFSPPEPGIYGISGPNLSAQALGVRSLSWEGDASGSRLNTSRRYS